MNRQELIPRSTITMMCKAYDDACEEIQTAYALLESAQQRLRGHFADTAQYHFKTNPRELHGVGSEVSAKVLAKIKRDAWTILLEKMAIKKMLSIERRDKLESQLIKGELPEVSEDAILAMFNQAAENRSDYLEEQTKELYDFLRPRRRGYATNKISSVGRKVIIGYMVEQWGGKFRPRYDSQKWYAALDAVMSGLDGLGVVKSHYGPLYDAVLASDDGQGETDYFRFKSYLNGNLHLEFKRLDLLQEFNRVAGGGCLGQEGM